MSNQIPIQNGFAHLFRLSCMRSWNGLGNKHTGLLCYTTFSTCRQLFFQSIFFVCRLLLTAGASADPDRDDAPGTVGACFVIDGFRICFDERICNRAVCFFRTEGAGILNGHLHGFLRRHVFDGDVHRGKCIRHAPRRRPTCRTLPGCKG